ncbi:MAG: hypothetical protein GX801_03585 [Fibrobacter sp.]|nr:hypothetical protein [Fibrobacter sp.]
MNNSLIAKVLITNQLATKEQIQKFWSQSSDEHNIAAILVENGELEAAVYEQVIAFVADHTAAQATVEEENIVEESPGVEDISLSNQKQDTSPPRIGARPRTNTDQQVVSSNLNADSTDFAVEGNSVYGTASLTEVESISGLQDTRMSDFSTLSTAEELVSDTQWIFNHGLQKQSQVSAALVPGVESDLSMLLATARKNSATELLLSINQGLYVRIGGELKPLSDETPSEFDLKRWYAEIIDLQGRSAEANSERGGSYNFAISGWGRFIASVHKMEKRISAIEIQLVPTEPVPWASLNLPEFVRSLPESSPPLVLFSGHNRKSLYSTLLSYAMQYQQVHQTPIYWLTDNAKWLADTSEYPFVVLQPEWHGQSLDMCVSAIQNLAPGLFILENCADYHSLSLVNQVASLGWSVLSTIPTLSINQSLAWLMHAPKSQLVLTASNLKAIVTEHFSDNQATYECLNISPEMSKAFSQGNLSMLYEQIKVQNQNYQAAPSK